MSTQNLAKLFWRLVLTGTILLVVIFIFTQILIIVPIKYDRFVTAVLVGLILYFIFRILIGAFSRVVEKNMNKKSARPIIFLISLLGYFIIIMAILASMGLDLSSIIIGSSFGSVIIGLAAQQVLSNIFAGILIIWNRPFIMGDYVEIATWQYGFLMPTIAPKFFSRDEFLESIKGTVEEISMFYTIIKNDDGVILKIPNSIVIQAAIVTNSHLRLKNFRFEVPRNKDFENIKKMISQFFDGQSNARLDSIYIEELTLNTYLVNVKYQIPKDSEHQFRTALIEETMKYTS